MTKNNEVKLSIHPSNKFPLNDGFLVILMGLFILCSLVDNRACIFSWPEGYEELIGGASQILTGIISFVVSIIGIAISLQNEEVFGLKLTKLYALRVEEHYSFLQIIRKAVLLCAANMVFYLTGYTLAAIGTAIVSLLFLFKVMLLEIPIMAKQEDALIEILKNNFITCYIGKKEPSKDLKDALKYLLFNKTLKETYDSLKHAEDNEYNEHLLLKLLDIQQHLAFEIKDKYSNHEQRVIASSLLDNVIGILHNDIDISDSLYLTVAKNKHLLTRVLFCIYNLKSSQSEMLNVICGLYQSLAFTEKDKKQQDLLIASIIIILATNTIRDKDFAFIKAIRKQLSATGWGLREPTTALSIFAVISLYFYYLCCSEPDVPKELKEEILSFIDESNLIEDRTIILSWKQLFAIVAEKFAVDYDEFITLSTKEHDLEYYLFGHGAKTVIISLDYLSRWYLANLFNATAEYTFDFPALVQKYPSIKNYLKSFGESCLDENQEFAITDEIEEMLSFYGKGENAFLSFLVVEKYNHTFSKYINSIKYEELKNIADNAKKLDNITFAEKIKNRIIDIVESEWGFDKTLSLDGNKRYFAVILEKFPDALNFEETIIEFCTQSVLQDIEKTITKDIIYKGDTFENKIDKLLLKNIKYISTGAKKTHPFWLIKNNSLQQKLNGFCDTLDEFDSKILGSMVFVANEGFKFNCDVNAVDLRELTEEELSNQTAKYQRADGQFVFHGTFMPKEEITEIIRDKFAVLTIVVQHRAISSTDTIIEIRPYSEEQ